MVQQENTLQAPQHLLRLENRNSFVAEGISEVLGYDESAVAAAGAFGRVVLQGRALRILAFDRAAGRLSGEGEVESVRYLSAEREKTGLLQRLLR